MPKKGSNFIPLVLDTRLLVAVNGKASFKDQLNATYIMSVLVEHCKDVLSTEAYKQLKARYSKTVYEQKKEKLAKEKARIEREDEKLALRKRELKIKEQTAKAYEKQTAISEENRKEQKAERISELKAEKPYLEKRLKFLKDRGRDTTKIENQLKRINQELEQKLEG